MFVHMKLRRQRTQHSGQRPGLLSWPAVSCSLSPSSAQGNSGALGRLQAPSSGAMEPPSPDKSKFVWVMPNFPIQALLGFCMGTSRGAQDNCVARATFPLPGISKPLPRPSTRSTVKTGSLWLLNIRPDTKSDCYRSHTQAFSGRCAQR
jgi:hypothetical protein